MLFETIGLVASLSALFFFFSTGNNEFLKRKTKASLLILLFICALKYALNAFAWFQPQAVNLGFIEDSLDSFWPVAWFFSIFQFPGRI